MKLYYEPKEKLHEQYHAYYECDVKYSDPVKQQLAEYFNDIIQDRVEDSYRRIPKIEGLPYPPDHRSYYNVDLAIKNLVIALVEQYYGE